MSGGGVGTAGDRRVPARLVAGTILLGIGLGGFFDGIVLHQILQWHHLLSEAGLPPDSLENLRLNVVADGLFHAATWIFTLAGVLVLWAGLRAGPLIRPPAGLLAGGILTGWGAFNLVEGTVNHHLLDLHHVRPGPDELLYDVGFLVWGAVMLVAGIVLLRAARFEVGARPS